MLQLHPSTLPFSSLDQQKNVKEKGRNVSNSSVSSLPLSLSASVHYVALRLALSTLWSDAAVLYSTITLLRGYYCSSASSSSPDGAACISSSVPQALPIANAIPTVSDDRHRLPPLSLPPALLILLLHYFNVALTRLQSSLETLQQTITDMDKVLLRQQKEEETEPSSLFPPAKGEEVITREIAERTSPSSDVFLSSQAKEQSSSSSSFLLFSSLFKSNSSAINSNKRGRGAYVHRILSFLKDIQHTWCQQLYPILPPTKLRAYPSVCHPSSSFLTSPVLPKVEYFALFLVHQVEDLYFALNGVKSPISASQYSSLGGLPPFSSSPSSRTSSVSEETTSGAWLLSSLSSSPHSHPQSTSSQEKEEKEEEHHRTCKAAIWRGTTLFFTSSLVLEERVQLLSKLIAVSPEAIMEVYRAGGSEEKRTLSPPPFNSSHGNEKKKSAFHRFFHYHFPTFSSATRTIASSSLSSHPHGLADLSEMERQLSQLHRVVLFPTMQEKDEEEESLHGFLQTWVMMMKMMKNKKEKKEDDGERKREEQEVVEEEKTIKTSQKNNVEEYVSRPVAEPRSEKEERKKRHEESHRSSLRLPRAPSYSTSITSPFSFSSSWKLLQEHASSHHPRHDYDCGGVSPPPSATPFGIPPSGVGHIAPLLLLSTSGNHSPPPPSFCASKFFTSGMEEQRGTEKKNGESRKVRDDTKEAGEKDVSPLAPETATTTTATWWIGLGERKDVSALRFFIPKAAPPCPGGEDEGDKKNEPSSSLLGGGHSSKNEREKCAKGKKKQEKGKFVQQWCRSILKGLHREFFSSHCSSSSSPFSSRAEIEHSIEQWLTVVANLKEVFAHKAEKSVTKEQKEEEEEEGTKKVDEGATTTSCPFVVPSFTSSSCTSFYFSPLFIWNTQNGNFHLGNAHMTCRMDKKKESKSNNGNGERKEEEVDMSWEDSSSLNLFLFSRWGVSSSSASSPGARHPYPRKRRRTSTRSTSSSPNGSTSTPSLPPTPPPMTMATTTTARKMKTKNTSEMYQRGKRKNKNHNTDSVDDDNNPLSSPPAPALPPLKCCVDPASSSSSSTFAMMTSSSPFLPDKAAEGQTTTAPTTTTVIIVLQEHMVMEGSMAPSTLEVQDEKKDEEVMEMEKGSPADKKDEEKKKGRKQKRKSGKGGRWWWCDPLPSFPSLSLPPPPTTTAASTSTTTSLFTPMKEKEEKKKGEKRYKNNSKKKGTQDLHYCCSGSDEEGKRECEMIKAPIRKKKNNEALCPPAPSEEDENNTNKKNIEGKLLLSPSPPTLNHSASQLSYLQLQRETSFREMSGEEEEKEKVRQKQSQNEGGAEIKSNAGEGWSEERESAPRIVSPTPTGILPRGCPPPDPHDDGKGNSCSNSREDTTSSSGSEGGDGEKEKEKEKEKEGERRIESTSTKNEVPELGKVGKCYIDGTHTRPSVEEGKEREKKAKKRREKEAVHSPPQRVLPFGDKRRQQRRDTLMSTREDENEPKVERAVAGAAEEEGSVLSIPAPEWSNPSAFRLPFRPVGVSRTRDDRLSPSSTCTTPTVSPSAGSSQWETPSVVVVQEGGEGKETMRKMTTTTAMATTATTTEKEKEEEKEGEMGSEILPKQVTSALHDTTAEHAIVVFPHSSWEHFKSSYGKRAKTEEHSQHGSNRSTSRSSNSVRTRRSEKEQVITTPTTAISTSFTPAVEKDLSAHSSASLPPPSSKSPSTAAMSTAFAAAATTTWRESNKSSYLLPPPPEHVATSTTASKHIQNSHHTTIVETISDPNTCVLRSDRRKGWDYLFCPVIRKRDCFQRSVSFVNLRILIFHYHNCDHLLSWLLSLSHSVTPVSTPERIERFLTCNIDVYDIVFVEWNAAVITPWAANKLQELRRDPLSVPIFFCVFLHQQEEVLERERQRADVEAGGGKTGLMPPLPSYCPPLATDLPSSCVLYGMDLVRAIASRRGLIREEVFLAQILKDIRGDLSCRFTVTRKIGAGSFGDVYEVRPRASKGLLAVKRIPVGGNLTIDKMDQLYEEVAIMREMDHKNVILLSHVTCDTNFVNVYMELCDGSLDDVLQEVYSPTAGRGCWVPIVAHPPVKRRRHRHHGHQNPPPPPPALSPPPRGGRGEGYQNGKPFSSASLPTPPPPTPPPPPPLPPPAAAPAVMPCTSSSSYYSCASSSCIASPCVSVSPFSSTQGLRPFHSSPLSPPLPLPPSATPPSPTPFRMSTPNWNAINTVAGAPPPPSSSSLTSNVRGSGISGGDGGEVQTNEKGDDRPLSNDPFLSFRSCGGGGVPSPQVAPALSRPQSGGGGGVYRSEPGAVVVTPSLAHSSSFPSSSLTSSGTSLFSTCATSSSSAAAAATPSTAVAASSSSWSSSSYTATTTCGRILLSRRSLAAQIHLLHLFRDILSGVQYIHSRNVVHRDIKPHNILLSKGVAKVADFGCAISVAALTKEEHHAMKGTLPYMAPEVFLGESYGKPCDMWSVGVLIAEILGIHLAHSILLHFPGLQEYYESMKYEGEECMPVVITSFVKSTNSRAHCCESLIQSALECLREARYLAKEERRLREVTATTTTALHSLTSCSSSSGVRYSHLMRYSPPCSCGSSGVYQNTGEGRKYHRRAAAAGSTILSSSHGMSHTLYTANHHHHHHPHGHHQNHPHYNSSGASSCCNSSRDEGKLSMQGSDPLRSRLGSVSSSQSRSEILPPPLPLSSSSFSFSSHLTPSRFSCPPSASSENPTPPPPPLLRTVLSIEVDKDHRHCTTSAHALPASLVDLLEKCFSLAPAKRLTADELLEHPIVKDREWVEGMLLAVYQLNNKLHEQRKKGNDRDGGSKSYDLSVSVRTSEGWDDGTL